MRPVDGGSLAVFRIGFGLLAAMVVGDFLQHNAEGRSGVSLFFTGPETGWTCPYPGLSWIQPLGEPWTSGIFAIATVAALLLAAGLWYRAASIAYCVTYWYIVLMDATLFGNHFPLLGVFAVLLVFLPAARHYSVDAWFSPRRAAFFRRPPPPKTIPWWCVLAVRWQTGLVYFFGGFAKLHGDWLRGQPLRMWFTPDHLHGILDDRLPGDWIDRLAALLSHEAVVYLFSYGGLIFDLSIVVRLAVRQTRYLAMGLAIFFHSFNYFVISQVGVVAPISFWATLMFLAADWPTRVARWLRRPRFARPDWLWLLLGAIVVPLWGLLLGWKARGTELGPTLASAPARARPLRFTAAAWPLWQPVFPLRHLLVPNDPYWTDQGVRHSWFLMTRNKVGSFAQVRVTDPALVVTDESGESQFDWTAFRGKAPAWVYVDVNAPDVRWEVLPELFVTFEPYLGERVFFNPAAAGLTRLAAGNRAREIWRSTYGRDCKVLDTWSFDEVVQTLRRHVAQQAGQDEVAVRQFLATILRAQARAAQVQKNASAPNARRRAFLSFQKSLAAFDLSGPYGEVLANTLAQLVPFTLQGRDAAGPRPLLINDQELASRGKHVMLTFSRIGAQGRMTTYADFDLMPWLYLREFDRYVPTISSDGEPSFLWNYTRELNPHQIEALELLPLVFHAYAQHVAEAWRREQGRRPQVRGTSYVLLNDHPLQPIIDEQVDLAATPRRFLADNPWILPLEHVERDSQHSNSRSDSR